MENILEITTERLILRRFIKTDAPALFKILQNPDVNKYLPMFPLTTIREAEVYLDKHYLQFYRDNPTGYKYAICLKTDDVVIGEVHLANNDSYDLGYFLDPDFWSQGIVTEACEALLQQLKADAIPYITATHDINNPASGKVMQKLGMKYQYSYEELWQPKDFWVTFRMYQLNLDNQKDRVYRKYWNQHEPHYVEKDVA